MFFTSWRFCDDFFPPLSILRCQKEMKKKVWNGPPYVSYFFPTRGVIIAVEEDYIERLTLPRIRLNRATYTTIKTYICDRVTQMLVKQWIMANFLALTLIDRTRETRVAIISGVYARAWCVLACQDDEQQRSLNQPRTNHRVRQRSETVLLYTCACNGHRQPRKTVHKEGNNN